MHFRALGTDRDETGEAVSLTDSNDERVDFCRYTDAELETRLGPDALQKKLLKIAREAQTAEEEQGVNILYLALGFLTWFEDKASSIPREAPLLLLPVELLRAGVRLPRHSNPRRRFGHEFAAPPTSQRRIGIYLPDVDVEDGWQPSSYFELVEAAISNQQRWVVDRNGIQLGFFSFSKLLMFLTCAGGLAGWGVGNSCARLRLTLRGVRARACGVWCRG